MDRPAMVCSIPGIADTGISLREDAEAAQRHAGFDPIAWHVTDLTAVEEWVALLDRFGGLSTGT